MYQKSEILRIFCLIALEKNYNFDRWEELNLKSAISQVNLLVKITLRGEFLYDSRFLAVKFFNRFLLLKVNYFFVAEAVKTKKSTPKNQNQK